MLNKRNSCGMNPKQGIQNAHATSGIVLAPLMGRENNVPQFVPTAVWGEGGIGQNLNAA